MTRPKVRDDIFKIKQYFSSFRLFAANIDQQADQLY